MVLLLLLLRTADDDGVDKDNGATEEEEGCDVEDVDEEVLVRICRRSAGCEDVLGAANMIVSTWVSAIVITLGQPLASWPWNNGTAIFSNCLGVLGTVAVIIEMTT